MKKILIGFILSILALSMIMLAVLRESVWAYSTACILLGFSVYFFYFGKTQEASQERNVVHKQKAIWLGLVSLSFSLGLLALYVTLFTRDKSQLDIVVISMTLFNCSLFCLLSIIQFIKKK